MRNQDNFEGKRKPHPLSVLYLPYGAVIKVQAMNVIVPIIIILILETYKAWTGSNMLSN
jgi:hypothetical protein